MGWSEVDEVRLRRSAGSRSLNDGEIESVRSFLSFSFGNASLDLVFSFSFSMGCLTVPSDVPGLLDERFSRSLENVPKWCLSLLSDFSPTLAGYDTVNRNDGYRKRRGRTLAAWEQACGVSQGFP